MFTVLFHGNPLHNYMYDNFFNGLNNNITSAINAYFRSVKHDMLLNISYSNFAPIYIVINQHVFFQIELKYHNCLNYAKIKRCLSGLSRVQAATICLYRVKHHQGKTMENNYDFCDITWTMSRCSS